jgi:hypothetical protein
MKRQFPPLCFEERMIAPIIIDPHPEEEREDEETVDNGAEGEIHVSKTAANASLGFFAPVRQGQSWAGIGKRKAESGKASDAHPTRAAREKGRRIAIPCHDGIDRG